MTFILIILGFVLIYLSIRNSKTPNRDDSNSEFSNILNDRIFNEDIDLLKSQFNEILNRIENLENSMVLIDSQMKNYINFPVEDKNIPDSIDDSSNISVNSFDNYMEKDLNSLIFQLSDEGKDLEDICSTLKLGKGEVLLRLGLRK